MTTGYPTLRDRYSPSMSGVDFHDEDPLPMDLPPERNSDADISTSQLSMQNSHPQNEVELGFTEGTLLQISCQ